MVNGPTPDLGAGHCCFILDFVHKDVPLIIYWKGFPGHLDLGPSHVSTQLQCLPCPELL